MTTSAITVALVVLLGCSPAHGFLEGNKMTPLKVASFNVRHYGQGFVETKPKSLASLVKILARYDIVLVMETRDSSNTALKKLKTELTRDTKESWDYVESGQLGRSKKYLEQYVFFYRVKSASFVKSYQIKDSAEDMYAREPFCVEFEYEALSKTHSREKVITKSVVFMALHTPPDETRKELTELPKTIRSVAGKFPKSTGVITMGDMNADCRYLAGKWRKSLKLFNDDDFKSLIPDSADTATKESSNCAYDRVVLYGDDLDVTDAKVFDYGKWLGLSEKEALDVSDHFPVQFVLH